MRLIALIILTFAATANAQYGIGLTPATMCNGNYSPASAVVDPSGLVANERSRYDYNDMKMAQLEAQKKSLAGDLKYAEKGMEEVLTETAMSAIREHQEHHNRYASYRKSCGPDPRPHVDTGTDSAVFGDSGRAVVVEVGVTQVPPPDGFCIINPATGQRANVWEKFVEDSGTVSDKICNFRISGIARAADAIVREHCRQGMHDYYRIIAEEAKFDREIRDLEEQSRAIARDLRRVSDEVTDGTFCWSCHAQRLGSNGGVMPFLNQGGSILQGAGPGLVGGQGPAGYVPYGGAGYPVRPYQSTIPGYYNLSGPPGAVQYGGVPGGIGAGGFGCNNANPLAQGGLNASPNQVPIISPFSPLNNTFANPALMTGLNQGAGPWGFPQYPNGVPAFNQFGQPVLINPLNPLMSQNKFGLQPPGAFGPVGGPYSAFPFQSPGYYGGAPPPGILPYQGVLGVGSLYGNNFGPGYGTPMWAGLYGGIPGYGPQWGAQPYNNFGQVNYLTNRLQLINTGGGAYTGGYAPVPYLTTPIYNGVTPGPVRGLRHTFHINRLAGLNPLLSMNAN